MVIKRQDAQKTGRRPQAAAPWRRLMKGAAALALVVLCGCASAPARTEITRVVAFGDSNVDTGNLFRLTNQTIPAPPRWQGRESNGPLMVEYLAAALHARLESHAVSGATSGVGNIVAMAQPQFAARFEGLKTSGLLAQVDRFIQYGGAFRNNDLVVVWAGSNDLYRVPAQNTAMLAQRIGEVSANLEQAIERLHAAGARRMMIVNRTPRDVLGASNDIAGVELNAAIAALVQRMQSLHGRDIQLFDAYAAVREMVQNPARNGFTEARAWCISLPACADEKFDTGLTLAETFINWDGAHKTTKVHRLIAQQMLQMLTADKAPH